MVIGPGATVFVTGAAGFIGSELVRVLVARGSRVFGLVRSQDSADRVRRAGATPIVGDLLEPGPWQDAAAADWVVHVPPHPWHGRRMTRERAMAIADARVVMDGHLLDAVAESTQRIVYVADPSCCGATGARPVTEDAPRHPSEWGRRLMPALERLDRYRAAGLPIITAFPGWVYGNGAWFRDRIVDPILDGRRVLQFGTEGPWVSPIHAHDCARAIVHLAERGERNGEYFLVNTDPIRAHEFATTTARLANRPLKVWRVPRAAASLVLGPVLGDYLQSDAVLSNIRLRATGFRFRFHTVDAGVRDVLESVHA